MSMTDPPVKSFDLATVLSLTTGVLMTHDGKNFGDMHELAEHLMGRPIWTHQFASKQLWDQMAEAMYGQHPWVREVTESYQHPTHQSADLRLKAIYEWRNEQDRLHPGQVRVIGGVDGRSYSALVVAALAEADQLMGDRPVVTVYTDGGAA